jgi:iron complex transport system permease protein
MSHRAPLLRVPVGWVLLALGLAGAATVLLASAVGSVAVSPGDQLSILWRALSGRGGQTATALEDIFLSLRLPRVFAAYCVGMSLACVGALFQALLRNPLAEPYIVGVSPGASLGATLFLVLAARGAVVAQGAGHLTGMALAAFVGGVIAVVAAYLLASQGRFLSLADILLAGIAIGALCTAATSYLWIRELQDFRGLMYWLMGNLAGRTWRDVLFLGLLGLPVVGVCWRLASGLNLMLLGEEHAAYLGLNVERFKRSLLALGTLLTAATVATAGVIGFVGIIVPHLVRRLLGADNGRVIPASSLLGGAFLVLCDLAARTLVAPLEMPVGMVTALIGVPFFLYVLRRSHRKM